MTTCFRLETWLWWRMIVSRPTAGYWEELFICIRLEWPNVKDFPYICFNKYTESFVNILIYWYHIGMYKTVFFLQDCQDVKLTFWWAVVMCVNRIDVRQQAAYYISSEAQLSFLSRSEDRTNLPFFNYCDIDPTI